MVRLLDEQILDNMCRGLLWFLISCCGRNFTFRCISGKFSRRSLVPLDQEDLRDEVGAVYRKFAVPTGHWRMNKHMVIACRDLDPRLVRFRGTLLIGRVRHDEAHVGIFKIEDHLLLALLVA